MQEKYFDHTIVNLDSCKKIKLLIDLDWSRVYGSIHARILFRLPVV
jgi:hypothetical protein